MEDAINVIFYIAKIAIMMKMIKVSVINVLVDIM